jgi:hypothetical protein
MQPVSVHLRLKVVCYLYTHNFGEAELAKANNSLQVEEAYFFSHRAYSVEARTSSRSLDLDKGEFASNRCNGE